MKRRAAGASAFVPAAIELLADAAEGMAWRKELRTRLARIAEPDGGWNERVFPRSRSFGTAMGMLALLQPDLDAPARRETSGRRAARPRASV